jgi:hypothetical protein
MIRVELLSNLRFRICLKVFINTLVVFVGTTAVCWSSVIAGREIFVLESSCENGSGLYNALLAWICRESRLALTSSAISFFVLMPLARKKSSNGFCSSL